MPVYAAPCFGAGGATASIDPRTCLSSALDSAERGDPWTAGQALFLAIRSTDDAAERLTEWAAVANSRPWLPADHPWADRVSGIEPAPVPRSTTDVSVWLLSDGDDFSAATADVTTAVVDLPPPGTDPSERAMTTALVAAHHAHAVAWKHGDAFVSLPAAPLLNRLVGGLPEPTERVDVALWLGRGDAWLRDGRWIEARGAFATALEYAQSDSSGGAGSQGGCGWAPTAAYGVWLMDRLAGTEEAARSAATLREVALGESAPATPGSSCPPAAFWQALSWVEATGRGGPDAGPPPCDQLAEVLQNRSLGARTALIEAIWADARRLGGSDGAAWCTGLPTPDATPERLLVDARRTDRGLLRGYGQLVATDGLPLHSAFQVVDAELDSASQRWHAASTAKTLLLALARDDQSVRWQAAPGVAAGLCKRAVLPVQRSVHTDRQDGFERRIGQLLASVAVLAGPCDAELPPVLEGAMKLLAGGPSGLDGVALVAYEALAGVSGQAVRARYRREAVRQLGQLAAELSERDPTAPSARLLRLAGLAWAVVDGDWATVAAELEREAQLLLPDVQAAAPEVPTPLARDHALLQLGAALLHASLANADAATSVAALEGVQRLNLPALWGEEAPGLAAAEVCATALRQAIAAWSERERPSLGALADLARAAQAADSAVRAEDEAALSTLQRAWLGWSRALVWAATAALHGRAADAQTAELGWRRAADALREVADLGPSSGPDDSPWLLGAGIAAPLAAAMAAAASDLDQPLEAFESSLTAELGTAGSQSSLWRTGGGPSAGDVMTRMRAAAERALKQWLGAEPAAAGSPDGLDCELNWSAGHWGAAWMSGAARELGGHDAGAVWPQWFGFRTASPQWSWTCQEATSPAAKWLRDLDRVTSEALTALLRADQPAASVALAHLAAALQRGARLAQTPLPIPSRIWTRAAWSAVLGRFAGHFLVSQQIDAALSVEWARRRRVAPDEPFPAPSEWDSAVADAIPDAEQRRAMAPLVALWAQPDGPRGLLAAAAAALSYRTPWIDEWAPFWAADVLWASFGRFYALEALDDFIWPPPGPALASCRLWKALRTGVEPVQAATENERELRATAEHESILADLESLAEAGWLAEAALGAARWSELQLTARHTDRARDTLQVVAPRVSAQELPALVADMDRARLSLARATADQTAQLELWKEAMPRLWAFSDPDTAWTLVLDAIHAVGPSGFSRDWARRWAREAEERGGPQSAAAITTGALHVALSIRAAESVDDRVWALAQNVPAEPARDPVIQATLFLQKLAARPGDAGRQATLAAAYLRWLFESGEPFLE